MKKSGEKPTGINAWKHFECVACVKPFLSLSKSIQQQVINRSSNYILQTYADI